MNFTALLMTGQTYEMKGNTLRSRDEKINGRWDTEEELELLAASVILVSSFFWIPFAETRGDFGLDREAICTDIFMLVDFEEIEWLSSSPFNLIGSVPALWSFSCDQSIKWEAFIIQEPISLPKCKVRSMSYQQGTTDIRRSKWYAIKDHFFIYQFAHSLKFRWCKISTGRSFSSYYFVGLLKFSVHDSLEFGKELHAL